MFCPRLVAGAALCLLATAPALAATNLLVNGSFESNFTGWTHTGAVEIRTDENPSDGTKQAVFNWGNVAGTGVLSQTFATTAGATYSLSFDYGGFASPNPQTLGYAVQGTGTLLSGYVVDIGTVPTSYLSYTGSFVADGAFATLYFADGTSLANSFASDLVLDRVVVQQTLAAPVPAWALD
ncbi:carbohydrate binding domain-containing protein [Ideonella livida]|uniref:CBM-cenC domain-containing protein n=1 Tax=Ideonella livida TaxID=2707176 RepID=A0A7C9TII8_9BURK|nr:carbohydrate binding domain-containing protein [Ideonella livida]NDY91359.1 hypothetical protein [Ideonella livida]